MTLFELLFNGSFSHKTDALRPFPLSQFSLALMRLLNILTQCFAVPGFILLTLAAFVASESSFTGLVSHKLVKRERAFDLAYIESELEEQDEEMRMRGQRKRLPQWDEAINDERCQARCNEKLRSGLDMVKAHLAFGSIGVPPVIDETDLMLFCRLDVQHDQCLYQCGFTVQFNMRDFVCKKHYGEMAILLPCYSFAAPTLRKECGASRCGPYSELEATLLGYAHRCRLLVCDLDCTRRVLFTKCGSLQGAQAAALLVNYTREQVGFWMRDLAAEMKLKVSAITPRSCSRIFCDNFDVRNCTTNARPLLTQK